MVAKRQKSQMELAFDPGSRGEAPRAGDEGTEATMTKSRTESSASMTRFTVRTAVYVTRTHGGVGGGAPRGAPLSRSLPSPESAEVRTFSDFGRSFDSAAGRPRSG